MGQHHSDHDSSLGSLGKVEADRGFSETEAVSPEYDDFWSEN